MGSVVTINERSTGLQAAQAHSEPEPQPRLARVVFELYNSETGKFHDSSAIDLMEAAREAHTKGFDWVRRLELAVDQDDDETGDLIGQTAYRLV